MFASAVYNDLNQLNIVHFGYILGFVLKLSVLTFSVHAWTSS